MGDHLFLQKLRQHNFLVTLLALPTMLTLTLSAHAANNTSYSEELGQIVRTSLQKSPLIRKTLLDTSGGIFTLGETRTRFFPQLEASFSYQDTTDPSVLAVDTGGLQDLISSTYTNWELRLSQELPTSTELFVEFTNERVNTNSVNVLVTPYYFSRLRFGGTHDLIRDFDWFRLRPTGLWSDYQIAKTARMEAKSSAVEALTTQITEIEIAYWEYIEAMEIVEARKSLLEVANENLEVTQSKIEAGILVSAERYSFEDSLAQRRSDLENALMLSNSRLQRLMTLSSRSFGAQTLPKIRFSELEILSPLSVVDLHETGSPLLNPTLARLEKKVQRLQMEKNLARTKILPSLNLTGAYFLNGGNSTTRQGFSQNLDILLDSDTQGFDISANLTVPLGPFPEMAQYRRALANYKSAVAELEQERLSIINQLAEKKETLKHRYAILNSRLDSVRFAKKRLVFERTKYERGLSPSFATLDYVNNLAQSQASALIAFKEYLVSQIELEALLGKTLQKYDVQVVESDEAWIAR